MPGAAPPRADRRRGLDAALGLEVLHAGPTTARGRFAVEDQLRRPGGAVHGAAYAALAETLCTASTAEAVSADGLAASASSVGTSVLHPVVEGTVEAEARRRHRGRRSWVWEVSFADGDGRMCALARVTVRVG